ncbi:mitochondrial precursor protein [Limtongia smithiae]|uniref:mitochondrial precursor protein n=1 Tax=Limtongia smithiae TaxID=1125753 RepID=UPI0034CE5AD1
MAPVAVSVSSASPSLWARFSKFVADNKTLVYGVSAATFVVVAGAGVYYVAYSDSKQSPGAGSSASSSSTPKTASEKKKAKKEKKKAKKEREKQEAAKSEKLPDETPKDVSEPDVAKELVEAESTLPEIPADTSGLSAEVRKESSLEYKTAGNAEFKAKNYKKAIELYTGAIKLYKDAIYFSNRAACYNALEDWDKAIEDSTAALELDPLYVKALTRRAAAFEKLGKYQDSVTDYTASVLLSGNTNDAVSKSIDRLLMKSSESRVEEYSQVKSKPNALPSISFVNAYLDSFHTSPLSAEIEGAAEGTGNYYLAQAFAETAKKTMETHNAAYADLEKAIELGVDDLAVALEMRGTYKFLMADNAGAMADLNQSIEIKPSVRAYVKRAMMYVEMGQPESCNADFLAAIALDPESPDVYYHRGQVHFLLTEYKEAAKNYQKAIDLDKNFVSAHIQLAVTQYKCGDVAVAMASFKRCMKNFENSSDVYNYFGELLMDHQQFDKAIEKFDEAFKLETSLKKNGGINVLPLVNKAYLFWNFKLGTMEEAEKLLKTAVELDPQSDFAIGTLAQLLMSQHKMEEALTYFRKQLALARSDAEIMQASSYIEAVEVQLRLIERYPQIKDQMTPA